MVRGNVVQWVVPNFRRKLERVTIYPTHYQKSGFFKDLENGAMRRHLERLLFCQHGTGSVQLQAIRALSERLRGKRQNHEYLMVAGLRATICHMHGYGPGTGHSTKLDEFGLYLVLGQTSKILLENGRECR